LAEIASEPGRVLVVAPAALLHEQIPQPDGQVLYELVSGYPDLHELLADAPVGDRDEADDEEEPTV